MTLRIDVLGTPRIEVDGEALGVDTRKATALLAYLAVTGGVHGRDLLVDLLWPDSEPDRGRAALRRTLSTLRSALGGRWLDAGRAAVGLELEDDAIDVRRFRALVASAGGGTAGIRPLTTAVMLHRDDLLAGFGLRDSVAFDDWQRAAAATLRGELEIALDRLVGALAEAGRADEAIAHCQRRLALDPLHEPAHRALIRLYAASGHRAEALSQYRQCVRVLDRELGVRPLPETSELYDAVNEGAAVEWPAAPRADHVPQHAPDRPLVGRAGEWAVLAEQRALCRDGGRLVVVEGEPGAGKTRLAEELLGAVRAEGGVAVEARSHDGEAALPLGLVAAVLRAALEARGGAPLAAVPDHWRGEAARLVPEVGGVAAAGEDDVAAQQRLHEGLTQVLCALLAGDPPGLLLLDDLQYADPASLAVIGYLARRLGGTPVLVVVCWRPEETSADHVPLRRLAGRVLRLPASGGRTWRSWPMPRASAGTPSAYTTRPRVCRCSWSSIWRPWRARIPTRSPVASASCWTPGWTGVGEAAAQLLAAAAVIGRSFDVDTLRAASGRGEDETVTGLEELTRRGLIVERESGYDFSHDKLLDLVYERASLARKRLLHRRVAAALAGQRADAALVARHLLQAGRDAEAAEAFTDRRRPGAGAACDQRGARRLPVGDRAGPRAARRPGRGDRRPAHAARRVRVGRVGLRGGGGAGRSGEAGRDRAQAGPCARPARRSRARRAASRRGVAPWRRARPRPGRPQPGRPSAGPGRGRGGARPPRPSAGTRLGRMPRPSPRRRTSWG